MHEGVKPFLMIEAVYDTHSTQSAVPEPVRAQDIPPVSLTATEASLFKKLVHSPKGRLEQEFTPRHEIHAALGECREECSRIDR